MIDTIDISRRVRKFADVKDENTFDIMPIIVATCKEINEKLKDSKYENDIRIIDVCVQLSYYRLLLNRVLSGDITENVKAGDVSVSQSPSLRLEWAAKSRDEAMAAAYPLMKDVDFLFRQVRYERS